MVAGLLRHIPIRVRLRGVGFGVQVLSRNSLPCSALAAGRAPEMY